MITILLKAIISLLNSSFDNMIIYLTDIKARIKKATTAGLKATYVDIKTVAYTVVE